MAPTASQPRGNSSASLARLNPVEEKEDITLTGSTAPAPPVKSSSSTTLASTSSLNGAKPSVKVTMHIQFCETDGNSATFKASNKTKLKKLIDAYCLNRKYNKEGLRFMFDGKRLKCDEGNEDTPDTLEMHDGSIIDVFKLQDGGGYES